MDVAVNGRQRRSNRDIAESARALATALRGRIVLPGDAEYDTTRAVWNGMHDRHPGVIVRAAGAADVMASVRYGREHDLRIAVRAGGHNVAGNGTVEGGLVIDLGPMKGIRVDPAGRTVRVEPGVTLGELDRETQPFGLAVPVGVVSATGVAGLTLGGGVGWLTRRYGLSIDSLVSADVVTADGRLLRAAEDGEAELFWGIRGGGGNFGIVTSLEFRAYPLGPNVYAGALVYERPVWSDALRAYAAWTEDLPDELSSIISFIAPPASWGLGERTLMLVGFAWAGADGADGERAVARLRSAAPPDVVLAEPTRWIDWQSSVDEVFPKGVRAYWKNASFERLDEATIATIVEGATGMVSPRSGVDIHHLGGAFARMPEDATAYPNRAARYWLNIYGVWDDPADDPDRIAWARGFHAVMQAHASAGLYVNFLGAEGSATDVREQALAAYGPEKLARLAALKRRYDPDNVFRLNHNIPTD